MIILSIANVLFAGAMAAFMWQNNRVIQNIQKENNKQQNENKKLLEYLIASTLSIPFDSRSQTYCMKYFKVRLSELRQGTLENSEDVAP